MVLFKLLKSKSCVEKKSINQHFRIIYSIFLCFLCCLAIILYASCFYVVDKILSMISYPVMTICMLRLHHVCFSAKEKTVYFFYKRFDFLGFFRPLSLCLWLITFQGGFAVRFHINYCLYIDFWIAVCWSILGWT